MWHRCFPYLPAMLKVMPSPYEQPLYASVSCWLFWVYGPPVFSCSASISTDSSSFCEKTIESGRPSLCLVAAGWAPAPAPTTLKWRAEGNGGFLMSSESLFLILNNATKMDAIFFFRQTEESPDLHVGGDLCKAPRCDLCRVEGGLFSASEVYHAIHRSLCPCLISVSVFIQVDFTSALHHTAIIIIFFLAVCCNFL